MNRPRIGCVQYLNTLPLIEGLRSWRDAEIVPAVPSRLIGMLRSGEVDVALASVVDAVGSAGEGRVGGAGEDPGAGVVILPVGMIGCDGPTLTVRLFSRVPMNQIRSVGVDTDSHTSAVLMQVVLSRKWGLRPRVVDFDATPRGESAARRPGGSATDALLLIGDKVVTDPPDQSEFPHQLDLGAAWKEMTGLPFVYAVWMCRAGEEQGLAVRTCAAMLDRQRRRNAMRLGWIVRSRASERHWPEEQAAEYVGTLLKYDVGEAEREAVGRFVRWAGELGLCPAGVEPVWAEP